MTQPAPVLPPAALAAFELIGRTGAENLELRYSDPADDGDDGPVVWMAVARYPVTIDLSRPSAPAGRYRFEVDAAMNPAGAVLRLAERLIDGGECTHCHRPTIFDADPLGAGPLDAMGCVYRFDPELATYRRTCEGNPRGNRAARRARGER